MAVGRGREAARRPARARRRRRTGRTTAGRGRTSASARARSRAAARRSGRRAGAATSGAGRSRRRPRRRAAAPSSTRWRMCRSGRPGVVLAPVPDRERRLAVDLPGDRALPELARARPSGSAVERRGSRRPRGSRRETRRRRRASGAARRSGYEAQSGATQQRRELRPARERAKARRARRASVTSQKPQIRNSGGSASFVFELDDVLRERIRDPREGERHRQPRPAEAQADEREPEQAEQVEGDRGEVRGGQVVPLAGPAESEVAGQVGLVRDRPVGVALRVRGLAAPVRLDAVADLAVGVGRAARLSRSSTGKWPYGDLSVRDPVGADHARVADVDHVRGAHVEPDPEARREDGRGREQPDRPDGDGTGAEPPAPARSRPCGRAGRAAAGRRAARS